ncbi:ATP-binding protein [Plantactinospora solaniradicis]|uniref:ATP-binding protein n=1 Tax=Plantactinospora solaniradicis TaxID=1723736 RepID=A0ABW1KHZ6_9ACTN
MAVVVAGCALLALPVAVVAMAVNPDENVNIADLMAVWLAAATVAVPLLASMRRRKPSLNPPAARSAAGAAGATVPRQLPAAVRGFAGRAGELAALTSLLDGAGRGGAVVISAVDGTAGVGKTALAVCWAHQVADRFPDGQMYVNLRGYDPVGPPMTPTEAVRGFLDSLDVPAERIPLGLDAQVSLYRSVLAGRRVLVVLDNARDAAQVRPLLPSSPGCMALVTSRTQLTSLIVAEGAQPLTVDLLSIDEARELLVRRLGADRVAAEPEPVREIITRCARLPLALSIVAARAAAHPRFPLAALAAELRQGDGGLQTFVGGEASADIRAVFSWSYRRLDGVSAQLFRLLGLHPGPDVTAAAAASMAGLDLAYTQRALAELARCHLLAEQVQGRYGFHDLLRAYAAELVHCDDPDRERHLAVGRMLDHYLHTANIANALLHPRYDHVAPAAPLPGVRPEDLADGEAALAWFDAEYLVLFAAVHVAADTGRPTLAWQLAHKLIEYLGRRGRWTDWAAVGHIALQVTQRHADLAGQADAHRSLGRAEAWLGRHDEAHRHMRASIDLCTELGDTLGLAEAYNELASVFEHQGDFAGALNASRRALDLHRACGSWRGLARDLNNLGWFHALCGEPEQAVIPCREALALHRAHGNRRGEGHTLDSLGYAHHLLGQHQLAIEHLDQSIVLARDLGDLHALAVRLDHLGDARAAAGNTNAARDLWQQALAILNDLGVIRAGIGPAYPDADHIGAKLRRPHPPSSRLRRNKRP